jgi:SAM-dependent methyltransferase
LKEKFNQSDIAALESVSYAKNYNTYIFNLISSYISGNEVLDFGAGYGNYCLYLKKKGIEVVAIEINEKATNRLNKLEIKNFNNLNKLDKKFKNIVSLNVLEHIDNDQEILNELLEYLEPGGRIILYLPASMIVWTKLDELVNHKRRYSKKLIKELANSKTLNIDHIQWVDFVGWGTLLISKILGIKLEFNKKKIIFYDTYIFKPFKYLDILFKFIIGKNIIVVISKKII